MTEQQAADAQARLDAATPGPWTCEDGSSGPCIAGTPVYATKYDQSPKGWVQVVGPSGHGLQNRPQTDAAFIAAAPTDLALALSAIRRVREACTEERCYDKTGNPTDEAVNGVLDRILAALNGEAKAASKTE